jgi:hypothetical protein
VSKNRTLIGLHSAELARANTGMGVLFTKIEPNHQLVLEKWIAQLMDKLAVVELEC